MNNLPLLIGREELLGLLGCPAWLETWNGKLYTGWVLAYDIQTGMGITGERMGLTQPNGHVMWLKIADYGHTWRCWTSRPTDKQMEALKWK